MLIISAVLLLMRGGGAYGQSANDLGLQCFTHYCYISIPDAGRVTWDTARDNCTKYKTRLVSVHNSSVQGEVEMYLNSRQLPQSSVIFTSAQMSSDKSWTWINGRRLRDQNSIVNLGVGSYVVGIERDDKYEILLFARPPNGSLWSICAYTDITQCDSRDKPFIYNNTCYSVIEGQHKPWWDARNYCLESGGDLAVLSEVGNKVVLDTTTLRQTSPYYVGLTSRRWFWSNSTAMTYTAWRPGTITPSNLDNRCVCLQPGAAGRWFWSDCSCDAVTSFICQSESNSSLQMMYPPCSEVTRWTVDIPFLVILGIGVGGGVTLLVAVIVIVACVALRCRRSQDVSPTNETKKPAEAVTSRNENGNPSGERYSNYHRQAAPRQGHLPSLPYEKLTKYRDTDVYDEIEPDSPTRYRHNAYDDLKSSVKNTEIKNTYLTLHDD